MAHGGIKAGALNRKIDFYIPTSAVDYTGQEVKTFALDFSAMSDVRPIRGRERMQHGREEMATLLYSFRIHFTPRLTVNHRVLFNGDYFDIQSFSPMGSLNRRMIEFVGELIDASKIVIP